MSYLLDKSRQRNKFFRITACVVVLIILFYFRSGIFGGLSYVSQGIFRPVLILGQGLGEKFNNLGAYFSSKKSLFLENENLKSQIRESGADRANYDSVVTDNASIKEILGRKDSKAVMVLSAILSKPNQSFYDTLVIDAGTMQGIKIGDIVFALGNVPIGRILETFPNSSKVILFSNAGEKTQALISGKDVFMELVGRGGGNFEMILPRDLILVKGDQVVMPGINTYVLAVTETIISDSRDPFTKALLSSPVNIQSIKFVEVEI